jgi:hypothetical protein
MSRSDSSVTARVVSLTRQYLAAPDELAARLVLQALALEVAKLEVRANALDQMAGFVPSFERGVQARAFDVAMDALKRERAGLEVVP